MRNTVRAWSLATLVMLVLMLARNATCAAPNILFIYTDDHSYRTGYSTDNYTQWAVDYIQGQNRDTSKPWFLWLCYGGVHAPYTPADRHLNDDATRSPRRARKNRCENGWVPTAGSPFKRTGTDRCTASTWADENRDDCEP